MKEASQVTVEASSVQKVTSDSTQLVKEQTIRPVATIYKAVQIGLEVPRELIEAGGLELKKLN